jgi:HlyD family secretion protein
MKTIIFLVVLVGIVAGGAAYYVKRAAVDTAVVFRTIAIERGDLDSTISATGTLEPEDLIDVGAQVTGQILSFGPDADHPGKTVDFGSTVHKGMLLALIDPTSYKAQMEAAEANKLQCDANLLELKAKLEQTRNEWKRAENLHKEGTGAISDTDYDTAVANYHTAEASVAVGEAAIQQAVASLALAKTNLGYTTIQSPVEGVVVDRRVNIGQTMVSNMSASSMFLIAKDLRRMQVWASVNEADVGHIHNGLPARFTVDTFPEDTFHGKVTQIRMNATMSQNVVTYTVVVTADNPDLKLLPYMTANILFEVDHRTNVCRVPNGVLRWKPQRSMIAPNALSQVPKPQNASEAAATKKSSEVKHRARLWVANGGVVEPLDVTLGITDGTMTEISGRAVKEGIRVVTGVASKDDMADEKDATNPFLPQMLRGRKPSG